MAAPSLLAHASITSRKDVGARGVPRVEVARYGGKGSLEWLGCPTKSVAQRCQYKSVMQEESRVTPLRDQSVAHECRTRALQTCATRASTACCASKSVTRVHPQPSGASQEDVFTQDKAHQKCHAEALVSQELPRVSRKGRGVQGHFSQCPTWVLRRVLASHFARYVSKNEDRFFWRFATK